MLLTDSARRLKSGPELPPSLSLDHVALPCADAAKSYCFYAGILGLRHVDTQTGEDWGGRTWLRLIFALGDGRQIVLTALKGMTTTPADLHPRGLRLCALAAQSLAELDAWHAHLSAAGLDPREVDHGVWRSLYFPDPSGTMLEITAPVD
jgi:catechol 2,3-dioxygenase-like lactoylglutathione lyase family enzyme